MRVPHELARGSLRITLGKDNTAEDVEQLLKAVPRSVEKLRRLAPNAPPVRTPRPLANERRAR